MSEAIVSIQIVDDGKKRVETYLRHVIPSTKVEDVRAAVTEMLAHRDTYKIGSRSAKPAYQRVRALKKAEEHDIKETVTAIADAAFT